MTGPTCPMGHMEIACPKKVKFDLRSVYREVSCKRLFRAYAPAGHFIILMQRAPAFLGLSALCPDDALHFISEETPMTKKPELTLIRPDLLVDSRTIATRLENQHASTMLLIQNNLAHFEGFGQVRFEIDTLQTAGGPQKTRFALLNEDQCCFLLSLSRNSETVVTLKASLVYSFKKVREAATLTFALPTTMAEALRLAADALERNQALEAAHAETARVLEVTTPKAESFDRYLSTKGLHDLDEAAKLIGWGRDQMLEELRRRKVMMSGENNQPYQRFLDYGYFEVKAKIVVIFSLDRVTAATFVTPKGVAYLNRLIGKPPVADTARPFLPYNQGQSSRRPITLSVPQKQSRQIE